MIQEFQHIFADLTSPQWMVFIAFIAIAIVRLAFLFLVSARVAFKKKTKPENHSGEKISLIITARNEEENIRENLPAILELKSKDYEVVAIDDFSQDGTLSVLGLLNQRYGHLKISSLSQETRFSVKLAQNIALKSASNNWVLFIPTALQEGREKWLQNFLQKIQSPGINVVLGYSTLSYNKGFLNLLYRVETFMQQMKSAAYILGGIPFVYSEENLAFTKENYFNRGGFGKIITEPYANVELIINSFIRKKSTEVNFHKDSVIRKKIDLDKTEYTNLLRKSLRIEKYLPFWKRIILWMDESSKLVFIPIVAASLVGCVDLWPLITTLIGINAIAQVLIIKIILNRLNERKIFIPSLVYGLLVPYYKLFFRWHFSRKSRKQKWRNVF